MVGDHRRDARSLLRLYRALLAFRRKWTTVLTTEDAAFTGDTASVPTVRIEQDAIAVSFSGPAAVVVRGNGV